tara:strand:+ start:147 stop:1274 length:1128 start_codon:yes stop_codon:yes gene_type:complete
MSEIKVNSIKGVGASAAAITVNNTDGTCTANITSVNGGQLGNRNLVINGKQEVNQRNATVTSPGYVTDRWTFNETTDGAVSLSQVVDAPAGFYNSLKVDVTTADGSLAATQNLHVFQNIEGTNIRHLNWGTANAKTVTVSFYVKTTKTGVYSVVLENSGADRCQVQDYTVSDTNWNRYSLTFTGDTSGTWLSTNGVGIRLRFGLASGSTFTTGTTGSWLADDMVGSTNMVNFMDNTSNDWYLTGCQLEVGSVATDFEHRSFGQELQLCKRYYQQINQESSSTSILTAFGNGSGRLRGLIYLPVEMRANPTVALDVNGGNPTFYSYTGGNPSYSSLSGVESTKKNIVVDINTSTLTAGAPYDWRGSDAFITITAEL